MEDNFNDEEVFGGIVGAIMLIGALGTAIGLLMEM